jgi:hypothetical protein
MRRFGPSLAVLTFLASTSVLPWDRIWLQGGAITDRRSPAPKVYEASQMTLGREALLWISADAADVHDGPPYHEVFFIDIKRDQQCGEPNVEVRWRPRRADLTSAPMDLDFAPFEPPGRSYALVTRHIAVGTEAEPETVAVDEGLLVTATSGEQLLFFCDRGTPLDMFVTMDPLHIAEYTKDASQLTPVLT